MSVRLRHPSLRNCVFAVVHYRPLREVMYCGSCGTTHTHKTYHLRLDDHGEVVVSEEVYERLRELDGLPLRTVGAEAHPQPQILAISDARALPAPRPTKLYHPRGVN